MTDREREILLMRLEAYAQRLVELDRGIRAVVLLGLPAVWSAPEARLRLVVWFGPEVTHTLDAYRRVYRARSRAEQDWERLGVGREMDLGFSLDGAVHMEGHRLPDYDGPLRVLYPPDTGALLPT